MDTQLHVAVHDVVCQFTEGALGVQNESWRRHIMSSDDALAVYFKSITQSRYPVIPTKCLQTMLEGGGARARGGGGGRGYTFPHQTR